MYAKEKENKSDTKYKYLWIENPSFSYNPQKSIPDLTKKVEEARIGHYKIDTESAEFNNLKRLGLNPSILINIKPSQLKDNWIYKPNYNYANKQQGDIRVGYEIFPNYSSPVTVFGTLKNRTVTKDDKTGSLLKVFVGTKDQAIEKYKSDYLLITWIIRIICGIFIITGIFIILSSKRYTKRQN